MAKVLVTGGAGFIGSSLAEELAKKGYQVVILDDLSTGKPENIEKLLENKAVRFVQGSITDLALLQELCRGVKYVFHQAALARVPFSVDHPLAANETNITGTLNTLLAARDNGVSKLIYAASSSVYGNNSSLPQQEDMKPDPLSPYALTKLTGEYYCGIFKQLFGLSTVCLRYFNVYGPRQDPHSQYAMVIPAFIDRILHGLPPLIYGDGEQSRDFTFVQDVVQANLLAATTDAEGVYNIGGGKNITINRLAETVLELMGKKMTPVHESPRPGDARHTLADISKAATFGYKPEWSLIDGIKQVIARLSGEAG